MNCAAFAINTEVTVFYFRNACGRYSTTFPVSCRVENRLKNIWLKMIARLSLPSFKKGPVRLRARTPPFHGGDTGSNPVRATEIVSLRFKTSQYVHTVRFFLFQFTIVENSFRQFLAFLCFIKSWFIKILKAMLAYFYYFTETEISSIFSYAKSSV